MLKPGIAIALPAVVLGIGLAHTTPEARASYLSSLQHYVGLIAPAAKSVTQSSIATAQPFPRVAMAMGADTTAIEPDRYGQYETTMLINGTTLPALVDTGASFVSLSAEDAASIGIRPPSQAFTGTMHTANGIAKVALVTVPHIRVGNVEAYNVQAVVSQSGALTLQNLLGMSFLKKLSGFGADGGRMVLRQ